MPTIAAGLTELYYEVRGSGAPVLLIMGATGDAEHFAAVAELLADHFTVVTYDRRGNSRSPSPPGWSTTSVEEQADDAAGLLQALALAPAAVFGTSTGATIALCLLIRHPEAVSGAILHEPPLLSVLGSDEVQAAVAATIQEGAEEGGPRGGLAAFWRFVAGDAGWNALEPGLRNRMLDSSETFLGVEMGAFEGYRPDDDVLAKLPAPVQVLMSEQSPPFLHETARWLAGRAGVPVSHTPGTHTPYHDHPEELVHTIHPFLSRVSSPPAPP